MENKTDKNGKNTSFVEILAVLRCDFTILFRALSFSLDFIRFVHSTRSPHLRLLQPIIRNSERKRRLGVNLAPIKFHIFYQVRFWYPLETNVKKVFMAIY